MFSTKTIELKSAAELDCMRRGADILSRALAAAMAAVRPGATTLELDRAAAAEIGRLGATPAFLGYRGFPATVCISINDEVVHGIPSAHRRVKEGDIVGLDLGCVVDGYYADCAFTLPAGEISPDALGIGDDQGRPGVVAPDQRAHQRAAQPGKLSGRASALADDGPVAAGSRGYDVDEVGPLHEGEHRVTGAGQRGEAPGVKRDGRRLQQRRGAGPVGRKGYGPDRRRQRGFVLEEVEAVVGQQAGQRGELFFRAAAEQGIYQQFERHQPIVEYFPRGRFLLR